MGSFARALEVDEPLARTLMRAMYSLDPEVEPARASVGAAYGAIIDRAIGDEPVFERDAAILTLAHVFDSVILGWLSGRRDTNWVRDELAIAMRVLVRR
jgi:hypothetical protein